MTQHLTIIDQETREELAQIGMETSRRLVLCKDCKFQTQRRDHQGLRDICAVNHLNYTTIANPLGECEKFDPLPPADPLVVTAVRVAKIFAIFGTGFLLGSIFF